MQIARHIIDRLGLGGLHADAFSHRLDTLTLATPDRRVHRSGPRPALFGARRAAA